MRSNHKYGAKPTIVDGIRFASLKESRRYQELKLLEKAGVICALYVQPRYDLHGGDFETKPIGRYVGDFSYTETQTGAVVVEDVKGFKTPLYRWKKKHMAAQYGIEIREV